MDVAVKAEEQDAFAQLVAQYLVAEVKPILGEMIERAVADYFPPHGMSQPEARRAIKVADAELADEVLRRIPSYPAGSQRRWWSNAIDEYLTHHNIA